MLRSPPDPTGKFKIFGVLPGRYYVVAGPREHVLQPGLVARSYFEELARRKTAASVATSDLMVTGASKNLDFRAV